jgi:sugar lactone lactonase YvrE
MMKWSSTYSASFLLSTIFLTLLFSMCKVPKTEIIEKDAIPVKSSPIATLGEGAIWDHEKNVLLWIDINGKKLNTYDPHNNEHKQIDLPKIPGTVVPESDESAIIALEDGIYRINRMTGQLSFLSKPDSLKVNERFNDGKCDRNGRLWVGTMKMNGKSGNSHLYKYEKESGFKIMRDSVHISNGITWSLSGDKMYYIDTPTGKVVSFDFDNKSGSISNEQVSVMIPDSLGHPDGMTIDEEGKIWIALWGGHGVGRYDPVSGKLIGKIYVPVKNVTSCAFGGRNLDTLYITTAKWNMDNYPDEQKALAGALFYTVPGVSGIKSNFYKE